MAFWDFLLGKGEKTQEYQRYNPQQNQALDMLLSGGQQQLPQAFQFLQSILSQDPAQMQAFERPAMRQFEEQIIPGIAEKFTANFGPGSYRSSAFGQQLGAAGAKLAENLQAQRAGLGMQGIQQLIQMLGGGLGQRTGRETVPGQPGALQGIMPALGQLGSAYLGAPGLGG